MTLINGGYIRQRLEQELGKDYATMLINDQQKLIDLYAFYDGAGQLWQTNGTLEYTPTKRIVNKTQSLVDDEARYMFGRPPEIRIVPEDGDAQEAVRSKCEALQRTLGRVLRRSGWRDKLPKAGRDALIGKRVALKVSGGQGKPTKVQFRPSLEFWHDYAPDDVDDLRGIIFLYQLNNESEPSRQRFWLQQYKRVEGRVLLSEGTYDGNGWPMEGEIKDQDTNLSRIPCSVIINDGLTGDVLGRSDVDKLRALADGYNRAVSDDTDALRFNMFPSKVFTDASEESMKSIVVAPGAQIDLQSEPAGEHQAKCDVLESAYSYSERIEAHLDRIIKDMHHLTGVPDVTMDELKALGVSGKAMRAIYWPLTTRCEEKWASWDAALEDMVRTVAELEGYADLAFEVRITHLYPIAEDEDEERAMDLREVGAQVRSRTAYIEKWDTEAGKRSPEDALTLMATERVQLEESYIPAGKSPPAAAVLPPPKGKAEDAEAP